MPLTTLEDMKRGLLQLLIEEMNSSLAQSKERVRSQRRETLMTSEEELEALVEGAVKKARRRHVKPSRNF